MLFKRNKLVKQKTYNNLSQFCSLNNTGWVWYVDAIPKHEF